MTSSKTPTTRSGRFLQLIAPQAQRLFLGDLNQCICSFKKDDPHGRVAEARASRRGVAAATTGEPPRPPRVCCPPPQTPHASATSIIRRFREAVAAGRLRLVEADSVSHHQVTADLVTSARGRRHTVRIFTHTIKATSELSDTLTTMGITHEQVGFGEAQGEAAGVQMEMLTYALAIPGGRPRRAGAVYVTATTKGGHLPELAEHLMNRSSPALGWISSSLNITSDTHPSRRRLMARRR